MEIFSPLIMHKLFMVSFLKQRSFYLIVSLSFSFPEIADFFFLWTGGMTEKKQCILVLAV